MASLKGETEEAMMVEELEVRDEEEIRRKEPVEELEEVEIGAEHAVIEDGAATERRQSECDQQHGRAHAGADRPAAAGDVMTGRGR